MRVQDVMTKAVTSCHADASLATVAASDVGTQLRAAPGG